MLSQPLDPKISEKFKSDDYNEAERKIKAQRIGKMFDDMDDRKISIFRRISWFWSDVKGVFYDMKYAVRNHFKWRKTVNKLLPWEGFAGLIDVIQTHLRDYIDTEEKYGHSEAEYKKNKIATAKETVEILERMKEPMEYSRRLRDEVDVRYPDYKYLITEYESGSVSYSGDFAAQGSGWAGKESGKDPREGYFEFTDGSFELSASPDQNETNRVLAELMKYYEETQNAYIQAKADSDKDFDRLAELLKENLYTWWD